MKRIEKKKGNPEEKLDPQRRMNKKTLEKKPTKGGTPAIEKKEIIIIFA
jgi:hypothetical protein